MNMQQSGCARQRTLSKRGQQNNQTTTIAAIVMLLIVACASLFFQATGQAVSKQEREIIKDNTGSFAVQLAPARSAVRTMPSTYTPGVPMQVQLNVTFDNSDCGAAVAETLPAGWTAFGATGEGSGIYNVDDNTIRWAPIENVLCGGASDNYLLTYTATPSTSATGTQQFNGIFSVDGNDFTFTGDGTTSSSSGGSAVAGSDSGSGSGGGGGGGGGGPRIVVNQSASTSNQNQASAGSSADTQVDEVAPSDETPNPASGETRPAKMSSSVKIILGALAVCVVVMLFLIIRTAVISWNIGREISARSKAASNH